MHKNMEEMFGFLKRAYLVLKAITIVFAAIIAFISSVLLFDYSVTKEWKSVMLPLYGVSAVVVPVALACAALVVCLVILYRDALGSASYYQSKSDGLEVSNHYYKDLAYNDSITGIPNTRGLLDAIERVDAQNTRCLVLLDLRDFGSFNKRFGHWCGDEYLRTFAKKISQKSRRDEYVFKKRPFQKDDFPDFEKGEVSAFRKNSGGDEFYILINGTILDGLGYLNRLMDRRAEMEKMAVEICGKIFPFGIQAGVIALGRDESFESADRRVSEALLLAMDDSYPLCVYWNDSQLPLIGKDSFEAKIVERSRKLFRRSDTGEV